MTSRDDEKIAVERQIPKTASGIGIPRHANAFESQPGGPGDDVHDHVPLSELADIVRSPGGARSASKGGRNYSWTKTESLAAVLALFF